MFGAGCVGAVVDARRACVHAQRLPRCRPPCFDAERSATATWSRAASTGSDTSAQWPPRYPKRVAYYRSEIVIAAIVLWLRADLQDMA